MKNLVYLLALTVLCLTGCEVDDARDPEFLRERVSVLETQIRFEESKIKVAKDKQKDESLSNLSERFDTIIAKSEKRIKELQRELEETQAALLKEEETD